MILDRWLRTIAIACIDLYQATLSPDQSPLFRSWLKGRICMHLPHCSAYAKSCFERYSFFRALSMSLERVSHCTGGTCTIYDPPAYRLVFFSSAPIGVPFLRGLVNDPRFDVVGVVTMPDAPVGRGMKLQENIIKQEAKLYSSERGKSVDTFIQTPQSLRLDSKKWGPDAEQCKAWITALQPDMLVVIAYGKLIPQRLLDLPSFGSINVHGSLLPKYRGASPLQSVFLHGDKESGITIMRMDAGLDTGDMLRLLATPLPLHRTVKDLIQWIQEKGPSCLQDTLRERGKGRIEAIPQDDTLATHCAKFTKEDGCIDPFAESILEIYRKRQAFALWPKLYFLWNDQRYVLHEMHLHPETTRDDLTGPLLAKTPSNHYAFHPCILSVSIAPEGKKQLTGKEFLDGYLNKG